MKIPFYKVSGSGNDFVIIDNRDNIVDDVQTADLVKKVCRRKLSVGADGLILLENADNADFKWQFFNSDGSRAEMCGNAARCVARLAHLNGIARPAMTFGTDVGMISAQVSGENVKIGLTEPSDLKTDISLETDNRIIPVSFINTGVPHVVIEVENIEAADVVKLGREIRFHPAFAPAGTNVNFIARILNGFLSNRTYERGVEDETFACGTGIVASALVMAHKYEFPSPVHVMTRGGEYQVVHYQEKNGRFYNIYLEGDARIIYKGELWEDSLK